jgi:hypothetical protein
MTLRNVMTAGGPVVMTIQIDDLPEPQHLEAYYDTRAPRTRVVELGNVRHTSVGLVFTPVGLVLAFGLWGSASGLSATRTGVRRRYVVAPRLCESRRCETHGDRHSANRRHPM